MSTLEVMKAGPEMYIAHVLWKFNHWYLTKVLRLIIFFNRINGSGYRYFSDKAGVNTRVDLYTLYMTLKLASNNVTILNCKFKNIFKCLQSTN